MLSDLCRLKLNCDVSLLNGGCLRTDCVIEKGWVTEKLIDKILAIKDVLVVKEVSGTLLYQALENSVSKYPSLDGRWPLLSNIKFSFDPTLPPMQRIIPSSLLVMQQPIDLNRNYKVCLKYFQAIGSDGYDMLKNCPYLIDPRADIAMEKIPLEFFSYYL